MREDRPHSVFSNVLDMAGTVASCLRKQEKEKTEISEITDYLYLSGCTGLTTDRLEALGITAAVCCIRGITHKFPKTIDYLYIPVEDEDTEDLRSYMPSVFAMIEKHRRRGRRLGTRSPSSDENAPTNADESATNGNLEKSGKVLVYCGLGISRSATFVISYLMMYEHMSLLDAYKFVQKRRQIICPNVGFFRQMIEIELELFGKQTVHIIKPVDNVEVPDVVWDEVYDEVMKRLNSGGPPNPNASYQAKMH